MEKGTESKEIAFVLAEASAVVSSSFSTSHAHSLIEALLSLSQPQKEKLIKLVQVRCDVIISDFLAHSYLASPEINQEIRRILAWANVLLFDPNCTPEELAAFLQAADHACVRVKALGKRSDEIEKLGELAHDNIRQIEMDERTRYLEDLTDTF